MATTKDVGPLPQIRAAVVLRMGKFADEVQLFLHLSLLIGFQRLRLPPEGFAELKILGHDAPLLPKQGGRPAAEPEAAISAFGQAHPAQRRV